MPAGKRPQSNAMLYTLITFVGLFIAATTVAVIYYVKFEEQRTTAEKSQNDLKEIATPSELRKIGTLIGTKQGRKSRLSTMVDYLDEMVSKIIGPLPEDTSAEVKVATANRKVRDTLELLAQGSPDIENADPNTTGLIRIIEELKTELGNITNAELAVEEQIKELQKRFDDAMAAGFEKEQALSEEKEKYHQQVKDIEKSYNELKKLMEQTAEQQVQNLVAQLDEERANRKELYQELLKTQAEKRIAQDKMKAIQEELRKIKPQPDVEVAAFKPDGKIMLIDDQAKIAYLNIGSDDRVYQGLTFSVYDKSMPIPKDGRGKAEIEVFDIEKTISAARIIRSEMKRPIVQDDIVANLIWDSDKTNVFVVDGDFDIDGDGDIDYGGVDKIKALVEKWGGKVADAVSIDTDFLVLGKAPIVRKKPTFEEMEVYPMAMEKYEASLQKLAHYKQVQNRAQVLSIPVFSTERFLYFIGHKTQTGSTGMF